MAVVVQGPFFGKAALCKPVLQSLPEWVGVEEATRQYIRDIEVLPTFLAFAGDDVIGFLTVRQHNECAAEIHVMGVHPEKHGNGVGRTLVTRVEEYLQQQGIEYLQVKTLSSKHPVTNYASTRAFYFATGFRPLEEFPTLWGAQSPCLQMIKRLGIETVDV